MSRSGIYYQPRPVSAEDLLVMRRMDELHLNHPFAGSRMLRDLLHLEGIETGRRHVKTLMKRMGIEAIYRLLNTSKPAPGHRIYRCSWRQDNIWRGQFLRLAWYSAIAAASWRELSPAPGK